MLNEVAELIVLEDGVIEACQDLLQYRRFQSVAQHLLDHLFHHGFVQYVFEYPVVDPSERIEARVTISGPALIDDYIDLEAVLEGLERSHDFVSGGEIATAAENPA